MNKAVYPGSFDPPTNGHLDIIERAAKFVDILVVAVLDNPSKKSLFSIQERVSFLEELTKDKPNIKVCSFSGLLVNLAKEVDAKIIIRGLRAVTDFEYEFQMALTNRTLQNDLETLFIPTSTQNLWISSSIVKEVAMFKGSFEEMVPEIIKDALNQKFNISGGKF